MLCQFTVRGIPLIILLCRVSVSDAVPFGPHPAGEARPTPSLQSKSSDSMRITSPVIEQSRSVPATDSSRESTNTERPDSNFRNSIKADAANNAQFREKRPMRDNGEVDSENDSSEKSDSSNGISPADSVPKFGTQENTNDENESLEKCTNEARRQNETYTRSIPLNVSSVDPGEDFKIAGEAEAKKESSVNVGEDIALCWIETTTIKEDPAFEPPKRLVIREFTISFENSATIPDNYLECDRLEGEIEPGDEETVRISSLYEIIDENTKRSREVNFKSVSRVGPLVVRQHRKIRCSVGAVVSKDIYEWPDGTDNPKKRVEIKIGPTIRDFGARTPEESRDCAAEDPSQRPEANESSSSSSDCISSGSCEISDSCEDGRDCNRPRTVSACEGNDCSSARGSPDETVPEMHPPDSDELLPTGVTTRTPSKEPDEDLMLKNSSTPNKPDRDSDEVCDENDTDCGSEKTTGPPKTDIEETAGGKNPESSSTEDSESCQEGSEDCPCSGSSCSTYGSDKSMRLETGNKLTEQPTIASLTKEPNVSSTELTIKRIVPLNDTECDGGSGECSTSSGSSSEEVASTKAATAPGGNVSDNGQAADNKEVTIGLANTDDEATTQQPGDSNETIGAATVPGDTYFSHEELRDSDANSSSTESTVASIPITKDSASSKPRTNDNERSCDESTDDEGCTSMDSSNNVSASKPDSVTTSLRTEESKKLANPANSATSDESEGVSDNNNDRDTSMPSNQTDERTPTVESTSRLPESARNLSLPKERSTDCSASLESGDCGVATGSSTLMQNETSLSSNQRDTTFSPESCESAGICGSTETDVSSSETSQASMNSAVGTKTPEGFSCDESTESCEFPSSSTNSESCEDGSSSGDCLSESDSPTSVPCDSASGSCSSESGDSASVLMETSTSTTSTTKAASKESENSSTTIDNVLTTFETRRSTVPNMLLTSPPSKGPHRLALRIKVLLERINENKKKEKLVHVEKNLLIDENPNEHGNQSLVWKIKSLNDTISVETLKAIFNCSAFAKLSEGVSNLTVFGQDKKARGSMRAKSVDTLLEDSMEEAREENYDYTRNESTESSPRKKREAGILEKHMAENRNVTDASKAKAFRESIPGVEEDLKKGMDHVLSRISKELDSSARKEVGNATESTSSNILKILASPVDGRVHSRRRRGAKRDGTVIMVKQLKNPVKGEEIDRWSNERVISAAEGGNFRSVMEFKLLKDAVEITPKTPLRP